MLCPRTGLLTLFALASFSGPCALGLQARAAPAPAVKPSSPNHGAGKTRAAGADKETKGATKPEKNAYNFNLPGPDGKDVPLSNFKGKYIVVVNLARKSTYNEQLAALIKLNDTYKDKNVVVLGVPSNDFGASEPGTAPEIQKAYADAKVNFAIMGVSKLSSDDELPLFVYLTKSKSAPTGGPVAWNYTKFIIDNKGNVVARLDPDVAPDSPEMLSTLDQVLAGTFKPKKAPGKPAEGAPADDDDE
jgi:glutathione peroxidase